MLISQKDGESLSRRNGDAVVLRNDKAEFRGRALIAPVSPGNLQIHWPEAEVLIHPGRRSPPGIPDYNSLVTLQRLDPDNRGLTTTLNERAQRPKRGKHVF